MQNHCRLAPLTDPQLKVGGVLPALPSPVRHSLESLRDCECVFAWGSPVGDEGWRNLVRKKTKKKTWAQDGEQACTCSCLYLFGSETETEKDRGGVNEWRSEEKCKLGSFFAFLFAPTAGKLDLLPGVCLKLETISTWLNRLHFILGLEWKVFLVLSSVGSTASLRGSTASVCMALARTTWPRGSPSCLPVCPAVMPVLCC